MAFIPLALQLLPLIPGFIEGTMKIIDVVKGDPNISEATRIELDALSATLKEVNARVQAARLPS